MQIRCSRQPKRLSRRPRLAHLFSIYFCFVPLLFLSFATTLLTKASFLSSVSFLLLFLRPSGEQRFRRRSCMITRVSAEAIGLIG